VLPVSIVISTRDRPALLQDAVASILAGDTLPREPIVAISDDDVIVDRAWLRTLVQPLLDAERVVEPEVFPGRLFADVLSGNNLAVPRAAFAEVALVDERLGPGGEFPSAPLSPRRRRPPSWEPAWACAGRAELDRADPHMRRRLGRNVRWRAQPALARGARGDGVAAREAIHLPGLASGLFGWLTPAARERRGRAAQRLSRRSRTSHSSAPMVIPAMARSSPATTVAVRAPTARRVRARTSAAMRRGMYASPGARCLA
jgi:hypothetical protein